MHSHLLDSYSHLDSRIRRAPAGAKIALCVTLLAGLAAVPPSPRLLGAAAIALLAVAVASRVPGVFLLKRMIALEPFVLGVALLTLLQPHGLSMFVSLVSRSTICLFALVLLSNTTPFWEIIDVLKRIRVPALMITTLALMYRFLFVLREESARMRSARASRTLVPSRSLQWRIIGSVIGQLFVRSGQRAERIYAAMCSRGWT